MLALALAAGMTVATAAAPAHAAGAQSWSDPATWGGKVPGAGDVARIPAGRTVVLDVDTPKLEGVEINGTLRFADRNLRLHTGWIMVHGRLQIGTEANPHTKQAEIVLDGDPDANIMGMGANVLGVMGGTLDLHGTPRPVQWTRLSRIAGVGTRRIRVGSTDGWRAGDRIAIASTDLEPDHAEERTITAIDGRVVVLDRPLEYTHWGRSERIAGRRVAQRAEVGLLTRNIVIRGGDSAARTGIGGHVMVHAASTARVSNVEFDRMGQAGRLARYPFHFHMMGSAPDSYIRSSAVHHSNNRCITVHGTKDVTVADNVGYETLGHCFFFEDGIETGVKLLRNLGFSTRRPAEGQRILDTDDVPATFWIQHPNNTVRGNAAAGSEGNGFWYDLPEHPTGLSATDEIEPREARFGVFRNNVAHTNVNRANQFRSGTGLLIEDYRPPATAVLRGLIAYKNTGFGVWAEHDTKLVDAVLAENNVGWLGRGSALRDSHIVGATSNNADKHWSMTGVGMYHDALDVRGVTFANFKPDEWRHGVAIGSIVEDISTVPRFGDVRFVNADRVRMTPPWVDNRVGATMLVDTDGSITGSGRASAITSSHPLLLTGSCRRSDALDAHLCPADTGVSMLQLSDHTGSRDKLGPAVATRDDGADYRLLSDPDWSYRPMTKGTVLLNRRHTVRLGRRTPANLEVVAANAARGWVQVAVPWPHDNLYVYDGWGEWARTLRPASGQAELAADGGYLRQDGLVHIRFRNDGQWRWLRTKLCAQRYCGEGLGTRDITE